MSTRTDDDLARAWQGLMGDYHRVSCVLDRVLQAEHGVTASEFAVLELLAGARPACSMKMHDLGERVHVTQSALSRLVARLESDGLLERVMCTEDRRSVFAQLTPAGRQLYRAARPTHRQVLRSNV